MPPPLLLLSASADGKGFQGVGTHGGAGGGTARVAGAVGQVALTGRELRRENSVDVKEMMGRLKDRWGSRSIL